MNSPTTTSAARRLIAVATVTLVLLAACSDDDGETGSGSRTDLEWGQGFSVLGALGQLPVDEESGQPLPEVYVGDVAAATELVGAERAPIDDLDALAAWQNAITFGGERTDDGFDAARAFVPYEGLLGHHLSRLASIEEIDAEFGWSIVDVDRFAVAERPPFTFTVVGGSVGPDTFDRGEARDHEDGIVAVGEGDDFQSNLQGATAGRPLGRPWRMAADDGMLVASTSTPLVRAWLDGERTYADIPEWERVARHLDDAQVHAAVLARGSTLSVFDMVFSEDLPDTFPTIEETFSVLGFGWTVSDDRPELVIVHHFLTDDTAAEGAEQVELVAREGLILSQARPVADILVLESVDVDGAVVVSRYSYAEEGNPRSAMRLWFERDALMAYGSPWDVDPPG